MWSQCNALYVLYLFEEITFIVAGAGSSGQIVQEAPPDLPSLMNLVSTRTTKWRQIGIELGLSTCELDAISLCGVQSLHRCFEHIFELWKRSATMPYTWDTIITALKNPQVNEQRLAIEIEHSLTPRFQD